MSRSIAIALGAVVAVLAFAPAALAADRTYVVVYERGASLEAARAAVRAAGGEIVRENRAVGVATVRAPRTGFERRANRSSAIRGTARNKSIGRVPAGHRPKRDPVENESTARSGAAAATPEAPPNGEPLSGFQWDMAMMDATPTGAYAHQTGSHAVRVGVIDTGVQGNHPDIAPNFNGALSRNFTTDDPTIDGPCADEPDGGCQSDPADVDEDGHGTHVASTIASPLNHVGIGGVAPGVELVNLRAGQDSGYFFLQPSVDALTYAGDSGIDVVNMSYYIDPWLYNCTANPGDSPEEQVEQRTIIEATQRALDYARARGVTLIAAAGNGHTDLGHPTFDDTSPDYPPGTEHERTIDNSCLSMPTEGEGVLAITSVGPTGRKAYYSDYGVEQTTVAAPGGDRREFFGTPQFNRPENRILAAYPSRALGEEQGVVDPATGDPTTPLVVREGDAYYQWIQGTSMASPHAVGVAALIVAQFGTPDAAHGGLTLAPSETERILRASAVDTPCPDPRLYTYPDPDLPATYTAYCEGDTAFNGFYGDGIANALRAVRFRDAAVPPGAGGPGGPGGPGEEPVMRFRHRGVPVDSHRRASVIVRCPRSANQTTCGGVLSIIKGASVLGQRSFRIAPDRYVTVRVRLTRRAFRRLNRAERMRANVYLLSRGADGILRRHAARLTVRRLR